MEIKNSHRWDVTPTEAISIQKRLRHKIRIHPLPKKIRLIAGADVAFSKDTAFGAVVVLRYPDLDEVEFIIRKKSITFPYIPGLLTFREGPVLVECFKAIKNTPDVIIFDGQGIAHPVGMGIATHMGIVLDWPTIGCAKSRLTGSFKEPGTKRGSYSLLKDSCDQSLGVVLRTRTNVRPLFVSLGNRITLEEAKAVVLHCCRGLRLPEPIRLADHLSKEAKKGMKI